MDLKIISWNDKGMWNKNKCLNIYQTFKNHILERLMIVLWGRRIVYWLALPSLGALSGILLIYNREKVGVAEHEVEAYSVMRTS